MQNTTSKYILLEYKEILVSSLDKSKIRTDKKCLDHFVFTFYCKKYVVKRSIIVIDKLPIPKSTMKKLIMADYVYFLFQIKLESETKISDYQ
jgi:hypothetical protein